MEIAEVVDPNIRQHALEYLLGGRVFVDGECSFRVSLSPLSSSNVLVMYLIAPSALGAAAAGCAGALFYLRLFKPEDMKETTALLHKYSPSFLSPLSPHSQTIVIKKSEMG